MKIATLGSPPVIDFHGDALFLDIDGTIAEIAERPNDVAPQKGRSELLKKLGHALNQRIAVLTGRTLEETDRILEGTIVSVAAIHGLVQRSSDGTIISIPAATGLSAARQDLSALLQEFPQIILEEKISSLAIHFRQAPHASESACEATTRIAGWHGLVVQNGTMVSEIRTPGPDKGASLRAIMKDLPFVGTKPIMVGDDLTDEHAFEAAMSLGGYGVLVGEPRPTQALYRLSSVDEVMRWLSAGFV